MKSILLLLLFFIPAYFYGQEFEYRVLSEKKIDDDLIQQTGVLTIFNNTDHSLCLRLSSTFGEKILSKDTVMLASMGNDTLCQYFKLWISDDNKKTGFENYQTYPLIINSKASFTSTISILLNMNCRNSWLEYRYLDQQELTSHQLSNIYRKNKKWATRLRPKFHSIKIPLDSQEPIYSRISNLSN